MSKTLSLYKEAKKIIPGGTQLLSKRPEMFLPDYWPAYYSKAKGCKVWDIDGKEYIDMSYMGIGSCVLGYADKDVNDAVINAAKNGSMCTLNAPEEVDLAKLLIKLHPWAEMVRYARSGGEAMSIAVRIARAQSKKDKVLFCGYHGWHDWYLSANLSDKKSLDGHLLPGLNPLGVPRSLKGLTFPFPYNDTNEFLSLIKMHKGNICAIVLEAIRNVEPDKEFLETIIKISKKEKIILIADEITSGWRLNNGGAHLLYGFEPDIAVFAKGISNGYPMAAIIGKGSAMHSAQDSFISSTYWTERIGPAAALATIKKLIAKDATSHLIKTGKEIKNIWAKYAKKHNIEIEVSGIDPLGHFSFIYPNPLVLKTLYTQEMLKRGVLATTAFYASYAHNKSAVKKYAESTDESFGIISNAIKSGKPDKFLKGPVCHSGFKRLT
jgi:glutamate-1-semialdehyde 2,1-aminomutase